MEPWGVVRGRFEQQMCSYLREVRRPLCTQVIYKLVPQGNSKPLNGVFFAELPICLAFLFQLYSAPAGNIPNRINT